MSSLHSDAGHEKLLFFRDGRWEYLNKETGIPMGIMKPETSVDPMKPERFTDQTLTLKTGDAIFQYSDGIPEALDQNKEFFGTERLHETINRAPCADPKSVIQHMAKEIDSFVGEASQFDDMTMLCLLYKKAR